MVDSQTSDLELAAELGFRVVKTPFDPPTYQYQKINGKGVTTSCMPTHEHAYTLWARLVETARELGTALDAGREGGEVEPKSSPSVRVA